MNDEEWERLKEFAKDWFDVELHWYHRILIEDKVDAIVLAPRGRRGSRIMGKKIDLIVEDDILEVEFEDIE